MGDAFEQGSQAPEGRKKTSLRRFHIGTHLLQSRENVIAPLILAVISFAPSGARWKSHLNPLPTAYAVGYDLPPVS
jgi:hypothetical protein